MNNQKGILLVDKSSGSTSFEVVSLLRRLTKERTIGHGGTLDPFATGVMVMLIGREFTRRADSFLGANKQYLATLRLGITTDTYDLEGKVIEKKETIPSLKNVESALEAFQGESFQIPPMFSAKKIKGKRLYDLARKGITIERKSSKIHLKITLLQYEYPYLKINVECSKGTYIRSLAHDLGQMLHCGAHLFSLTRTKSGLFSLNQCVSQKELKNMTFDITPYLRTCPESHTIFKK